MYHVFVFIDFVFLDIRCNHFDIKKNDNNKLTEIIKKSNDIRLMTIEEYEIYINNYIKKSKFPDIN